LRRAKKIKDVTTTPDNANLNASKRESDYRVVPLQTSADSANPCICVVVSLRPQPHFIPLGESSGGVAYLGCLASGDKSVLEWLEIGVQYVSGLGKAALRQYNFIDNGCLDRQWEEASARKKANNPALAITTSLETRPSPPILIDKNSLESFPLGNPSPLGRWDLCTDDAVLSAAGLAPYHRSLERFLIELDTQTPRVLPLTPEAGGGPGESLAEVLTGQPETFLTFNPQAGRLMVSRLCPISLIELCDLLGGQSWEGIADGDSHFKLDASHTALCDWDSLRRREGFLFNSTIDRHGRLAEMLHLKIGLILQAMHQVRKATERTQRPLLNLSHESFRVRFGNVSAALPFLWTAECCLVKEGSAYRKNLETTNESYFIRVDSTSSSIYHPDGFQFQQDSKGDFKCRNVLAAGGGTIIEGTLSVEGSLPVSPQDLIWLRVPLASSPVELFGHIDATRGATGELAFRSVPQTLPARDTEMIRQHFKFPGCSYEIIPLTSSPFDLYSMAVLSARCLLVGRRQNFNEAVDSVLSLARAAAQSYSANVPRAERIRQLLTDQLLEHLGPQHLSSDEMTPYESMSIVSLELWSELLAWITALFPGHGADSFCSSLGDAPPTGLEMVFDEPIRRLESLWLRTRRLIVSDGGMNAEIQKIIDEMTAPEQVS
jgi:hypothetical protein